jgi:hypothetical protein
MEWLAGPQVEEIYQKLGTHTQKMGGALLVQHWMDLFDLPTSFAWNNNIAWVFVHLPVIKKPINLYEFLPVPIQLGDRYIRIKPKWEMLMVGKANWIHQEVKGEELQNKCHQLGVYFMCDILGIFSHNMKTICLRALFTNDLTQTKELCYMEEVKVNWNVIQTTMDTWYT